MIIKRTEKVGEAGLSVGDFTMLLNASNAVDSSLRLDDALKTVLASAKAFIGAHEGSLMLLDPDGELRIVASEGIPREIVPTVKVRPGEGVAGRVLQTGRPLLLTAPPKERKFDSFVDKNRPLRSAVSVPMRAGEKVIGVLNLNLASGRRTFNEEDLRRAEIFARQAALAVQRSQWLEQAQHRASELGLLVDAAKALAGDVQLEPVMHRTLEGATKLLGSPAGLACTYDSGSKRVGMSVFKGLQSAVVQQALSNPGLVSLGDSEMPFSAAIRDFPAAAALGSPEQHLTVLPVPAGENTRAAVMLVGPKPPDSRVAMSRAFCVQAGIAITNARYYEDLQGKENEVSAILSLVPTPVILTDPEGRIMLANPAAEALFSISTEFTRGQHVTEHLNEPELVELMSSDEAGETEVVMGPVLRTWRARASAISPMGGTRKGRVLVLEDVSSGREAQQSRNDLVAVLGHELRTPLTLIKAYLDTLILRGFRLSPEQIAEALNTAGSEARRLERLVENLIFVNTPGEGLPLLNVGPVDLVALADGLVKEFLGREPARPITVEGPEVLEVQGDGSRLEQALYQLVDNATKFSEPGSPVQIRIEDAEDSARVAVVDRGRGILTGDLPALFQSFSQLDSSATREHGGTGTGLYIAKQLVEAHGGTIGVESIWGRGSTFRVTVPKSGPPEETAAAGPLLPAPGGFGPRREPPDDDRHAQETLGIEPYNPPEDVRPLEQGPPIDLPEPEPEPAGPAEPEAPPVDALPPPAAPEDSPPATAEASGTAGGYDQLPIIAPDGEPAVIAPEPEMPVIAPDAGEDQPPA